MKFWTLLMALFLAVASLDAEAARRLGGGKSIGRQSSNVTQREQVQPPAAPGAQPSQAAQAQRPAAGPNPGAAQPAPRRPWGAMLGGLAAGLGLAWLAHSLGFGEGLAQLLTVLLLAFLVMAVIGFILRARRGAQPAARTGGMAYQGAGAPADVAAAPRQYNVDKVGNDASARPWERNSMAFDASKYQPAGGAGLRIGSALSGPQNWGVPAGFDTEGFIAASKRNFVTLQDAWDRADIAALRAMMTDEMLGEIRAQLAERERHQGFGPNKTEVVMLEAQLLGIEDLGNDYMASVEFSGMIREEPSAGPSPFREVWNMTKPKDGRSGWLVAGVQALQ
jgi:predicted lipid-binding transport protein (Tim44 family)